MRFEIFDTSPPVRFESGDFLLFAPYHFSLAPGEYRNFEFGLAIFPDADEGISIRTYPELFIKKGVSVETFNLKDGMLELVLHNVNPPRPATNVFQAMTPIGSISVFPREAVCFLSVFKR